jgi:peptidoglycan-N-acetylglucosamine deacetylase
MVRVSTRVLVAAATAVAVLGGAAGVVATRPTEVVLQPAAPPVVEPEPSPIPQAPEPAPTSEAPADPEPAEAPAPADTPAPAQAPPPAEAPAPSPDPRAQPPAPSTPAPSPSRSPADALPASLVGAEWERIPTDRRVVALTFDAGANADAVPSILRTLQAEGVRATFFLTGSWVERYPSLAQQIAARYPIGNHTFTHPDLTTLGAGAVQGEIDRTAAAIRSATGQDPRPLFRFPFGARDARTIALVNDAGYGSFRWSVDTLGWKGTSGGMDAAAVTDRVLAGLAPGQIVLMHVGSNPDDGSTLDADALPEIIRRARAAGYDFVSLRDVLGR